MTSQKPLVPFLSLREQYAALRGEIVAALDAAFEESLFILGSDVEKFEQEYAAFCRTKFALGVSNGLDALRLALMALDIGEGDEVILPANTFIATALAVTGVGARPVLVDCDKRTYEINAAAVSAAVTSRTKAVIPVHLAGLSADMNAVMDVAERKGLHVIEDAAQAQGALHDGRPCGGIGVIGCTSFFPGKNLGAYGDAGGITTNDADLARKMGMLRNYGQERKYHHVVKGLNCRLDSLQAAVLRVKLRHLPSWNEARRGHAAAYRERLQGVGDLRFQEIPANCLPVYHLFVIETERRDALRDYLGERGVQCLVHYPVPIHLQPAYADLGHRRGDFPNAEFLADRILSLPIFPELTMEQIDIVCDNIKKFLG